MQDNKELYGLIGNPLSHSFSQKYFRNKFLSEKIINCDYLNFEIKNINQITNLLAKYKNLYGLNITIPFKIEILNYLDEIDIEAKEVGAVNTVKIIRKGTKIKLKGYNTDVYGFTKSLKKHLKPIHKKALILGSGGASKAVDYALKKINISTTIVSRQNKTKQKTLNYNEITSEIIDKHKIIINTTPLGMYPNIDKLPKIPYKYLSKTHILFDLIYNPSITKFIKKAQKYNSIYLNGEKMLKYQAEKSWKIFKL